MIKDIVSGVKSRLGGYKYKRFKDYIPLKELTDYPFLADPLKNTIAEYLRIRFTMFFYLNGS